MGESEREIDGERGRVGERVREMNAGKEEERERVTEGKEDPA